MKELNYRMGKFLHFYGRSIGCILLLVLLNGCGNKNKTATNVNKPAANNEKADTTTSKMKSIVFFGNSLTAGYGVDPSEAFPALIQLKIDSLHIPYKVINAGLSGETSAGGKNRI